MVFLKVSIRCFECVLKVFQTCLNGDLKVASRCFRCFLSVWGWNFGRNNFA